VSTPTSQSLTAVVVIGGGALSPLAVAAVADLNTARTVIAADSGLDHAVAAGVRPDMLVGDLDSISASGRMWAYAHGLLIDEHPEAKDETDTELALATAAELDGVRDLLVLGGVDAHSDDRLDHLLGTLLSLGHRRLAKFVSVRAVLGGTEVRVLHPGRSTALDLDAGQTFSLLALHGPCSGINVAGARWPLEEATLRGTEARGISNVSEGNTVIGVVKGVLTVMIP
jgi:thiamine pyrophosphokinase